ncbi:DNA cytosine methyltransferase, partial [Mycobacterium kansasii]
DRDSAATFRRNFPNAKFLEEDIRTLDSERLLEFIPDSSVTLFSGCAPCQPFSRQNGHRDSKDPRRSLLSEFQRIVIDLKPHLIVVENVPGLQAKSKEGPLFGFLDALSDHGYESKVKVVRALELGVPQERRR